MKKQFYTFYDFTYNLGYPPFRALTQSKLKSEISKLSELHEEWSEDDFIKYFRRIVLDDSQIKSDKNLAHWHLVAYVDKSRCYFIWREYARIQFYAARAENYYGLTNEILFHPEKFRQHLYKYSPQHRSNASFTTYILGVLKNSIKEKLQDVESDWHLLCNVDINSQRKMKNAANKLKEALSRYGIAEAKISQYIFAWQYFVPIYKKNNIYRFGNNQSRWKNPEDSDFAETARYCNLQKDRPNVPLQISSSFKFTSETIKEWMETCILALRQYKKITEISRDDENYQEGRETEAIDNHDLEESNDELSLEVEKLLAKEIENIEVNLPPIHKKVALKASQAIMPLSYSHHLAILNQKQLADWLDINQGTCSRYISDLFYKPLLAKLQNLIENRFDIAFYINNFLEKQFINSYNNILHELLTESFYELNELSQKILRLKYASLKKSLETELSIDEGKINEAIKELEIISHNKINKWLKKYTKLCLRQYYENKVREILLKGVRQLNELNREILKRRYCQHQNETAIGKLYPNYKIESILAESINQIKDYLLRWFYHDFEIVLEVENKQIIEIIESWLSRELVYLEI